MDYTLSNSRMSIIVRVSSRLLQHMMEFQGTKTYFQPITEGH